ncbi:MAG: hypothetical protein HYY84_04520 [Deltaproteobacteria bacterium]|nr:hypothetical protein [Deltaproteobacteria bacterium]
MKRAVRGVDHRPSRARMACRICGPARIKAADPASAPAPAPAPATAEDFNAKAQRSKDVRNETSSLGASAPLRLTFSLVVAFSFPASSLAAATPDPATSIRAAAAAARQIALPLLEQRIAATQATQLEFISALLTLFALLGLLLLFAPFILAFKHRGTFLRTLGTSLIAALLFVVTVELFAGLLIALREFQNSVGSFLHPQAAIAASFIDAIDENAATLASRGHALLAPLKAIALAGADPTPSLLLDNVARIRADYAVFSTVARVLEAVYNLSALAPLALVLLLLVFFFIGVRPVLATIITMPRDAALGGTRIARTALRHVVSTFLKEVLATLLFAIFFFFVVFAAAFFMQLAIRPAVSAFLDAFILSITYLDTIGGASEGAILVGLLGTSAFLALAFVTVLVAAFLFLWRVQSLFRRRLHAREPLSQNARFWLWGPLGTLWLMAIPGLIASAHATWLAPALLKISPTNRDPSFALLLVANALLLLIPFVVLFWLSRGFPVLRFLAGARRRSP